MLVAAAAPLAPACFPPSHAPLAKPAAPAKIPPAEPIAAAPANVCFVDSLGSQRSTYVVRLQEAFLKGQCVRITAGDSYMLSQLRMAAKKSSLRLVYGVSPDSKSIYVKPLKIEGAQKSLLLLLREVRAADVADGDFLAEGGEEVQHFRGDGLRKMTWSVSLMLRGIRLQKQTIDHLPVSRA